MLCLMKKYYYTQKSYCFVRIKLRVMTYMWPSFLIREWCANIHIFPYSLSIYGDYLIFVYETPILIDCMLIAHPHGPQNHSHNPQFNLHGWSFNADLILATAQKYTVRVWANILKTAHIIRYNETHAEFYRVI